MPAMSTHLRVLCQACVFGVLRFVLRDLRPHEHKPGRFMSSADLGIVKAEAATSKRRPQSARGAVGCSRVCLPTGNSIGANLK